MAKARHPLARLRTLTPWRTQALLAAALGVEPGAVSRIESGRQRLTARLAQRLREQAGLDDTELLRGTQARLLTLEGKPYGPQSYEAWVTSPRRLAEAWQRTSHELDLLDDWMRLICDAAASVSPATLIEARDLFTAGLDRVQAKLGLTTALNDLLVPWQTCELAAGDAAWWKKQAAEERERMGWSAALGLPASLPLALSIQAAPVWHPGSLPPGSAAPNKELFPPACALLSLDADVDALAAALQETLSREHAIHPREGRALRHEPSASWESFFLREGDRYRFRAGLAGHMATATPQGRIALAEVWRAQGLSGLFLLSSGNDPDALLQECRRLTNLMPAVPLVLVLYCAGKNPPLPSALRELCAAVILLPRPSAERMAVQAWQQPEGAGVRIAAGILAAFTAPLRYGSASAAPLDLPALLRTIGGGISQPVIRAASWPLKACTARRSAPHEPTLLMAELARLADRKKLITPATRAVTLVLRAFENPGPDAPALRSSGRSSPGVQELAVVLAWE